MIPIAKRLKYKIIELSMYGLLYGYVIHEAPEGYTVELILRKNVWE